MDDFANIPHVSVSALSCYARCPYQYKKIYCDGERRPPGIAAHIGGGVHIGAEFAMRCKAESHENRCVQDVVDMAVAGFEQKIEKEDVLLTPDEKTSGKANVLDFARDRVAAASGLWAQSVQPCYQPAGIASVEHKFVLPIPSLDRALVGIVDLETDAGTIVDWKTSRLTMKGEERRSLQLTAYALQYRKKHKQNPEAVVLDNLIIGSTMRREVLSAVRSEPDYNALLNRIATTLKAIQAGSFPPCNPSDWQCDPRFCGWHSAGCPFVTPGMAKG